MVYALHAFKKSAPFVALHFFKTIFFIKKVLEDCVFIAPMPLIVHTVKPSWIPDWCHFYLSRKIMIKHEGSVLQVIRARSSH